MARNTIAERSANVKAQGKGGFLKNIVKLSQKAQESADNDSYNVKESTVTAAKQGTNKTANATVSRLFSLANRKGKGLQFHNLQSYRTGENQDTGEYEKTGDFNIPKDPKFGSKGEKTGVRISSTAIDNINYNPKKKDLIVQFKNNSKKYLFPKVPESVVKDWLKASSKGRFYNKHVKEFSVAK